MTFQLTTPATTTAKDSRADEALIALAANGQPAASVWQTAQGLVVPRTYLRSAQFQAVSEQFADAGWPVSVRHSGGGVVPQGAGIINVSLAYAVQGKPLDHADTAYQLICHIISQSLLDYGIETRAQAVEGSFCDGRFNLATGPESHPRKVVGTAQVWRRQPGDGITGPYQVVLVHAIVLATADIDELTQQANHLEQALGNDKRYLPCRAASLHLCGTHTLSGKAFTADLMANLQARAAAFPAAAIPA